MDWERQEDGTNASMVVQHKGRTTSRKKQTKVLKLLRSLKAAIKKQTNRSSLDEFDDNPAKDPPMRAGSVSSTDEDEASDEDESPKTTDAKFKGTSRDQNIIVGDSKEDEVEVAFEGCATTLSEEAIDGHEDESTELGDEDLFSMTGQDGQQNPAGTNTTTPHLLTAAPSKVRWGMTQNGWTKITTEESRVPVRVRSIEVPEMTSVQKNKDDSIEDRTVPRATISQNTATVRDSEKQSRRRSSVLTNKNLDLVVDEAYAANNEVHTPRKALTPKKVWHRWTDALNQSKQPKQPRQSGEVDVPKGIHENGHTERNIVGEDELPEDSVGPANDQAQQVEPTSQLWNETESSFEESHREKQKFVELMMSGSSTHNGSAEDKSGNIVVDDVGAGGGGGDNSPNVGGQQGALQATTTTTRQQQNENSIASTAGERTGIKSSPSKRRRKWRRFFKRTRRTSRQDPNKGVGYEGLDDSVTDENNETSIVSGVEQEVVSTETTQPMQPMQPMQPTDTTNAEVVETMPVTTKTRLVATMGDSKEEVSITSGRASVMTNLEENSTTAAVEKHDVDPSPQETPASLQESTLTPRVKSGTTGYSELRLCTSSEDQEAPRSQESAFSRPDKTKATGFTELGLAATSHEEAQGAQPADDARAAVPAPSSSDDQSDRKEESRKPRRRWRTMYKKVVKKMKKTIGRKKKDRSSTSEVGLNQPKSESAAVEHDRQNLSSSLSTGDVVEESPEDDGNSSIQTSGNDESVVSSSHERFSVSIKEGSVSPSSESSSVVGGIEIRNKSTRRFSAEFQYDYDNDDGDDENSSLLQPNTAAGEQDNEEYKMAGPATTATTDAQARSRQVFFVARILLAVGSVYSTMKLAGFIRRFKSSRRKRKEERRKKKEGLPFNDGHDVVAHESLIMNESADDEGPDNVSTSCGDRKPVAVYRSSSGGHDSDGGIGLPLSTDKGFQEYHYRDDDQLQDQPQGEEEQRQQREEADDSVTTQELQDIVCEAYYHRPGTPSLDAMDLSRAVTPTTENCARTATPTIENFSRAVTPTITNSKSKSYIDIGSTSSDDDEEDATILSLLPQSNKVTEEDSKNDTDNDVGEAHDTAPTAPKQIKHEAETVASTDDAETMEEGKMKEEEHPAGGNNSNTNSNTNGTSPSKFRRAWEQVVKKIQIVREEAEERKREKKKLEHYEEVESMASSSFFGETTLSKDRDDEDDEDEQESKDGFRYRSECDDLSDATASRSSSSHHPSSVVMKTTWQACNRTVSSDYSSSRKGDVEVFLVTRGRSLTARPKPPQHPSSKNNLTINKLKINNNKDNKDNKDNENNGAKKTDNASVDDGSYTTCTATTISTLQQAGSVVDTPLTKHLRRDYINNRYKKGGRDTGDEETKVESEFGSSLQTVDDEKRFSNAQNKNIKNTTTTTSNKSSRSFRPSFGKMLKKPRKWLLPNVVVGRNNNKKYMLVVEDVATFDMEEQQHLQEAKDVKYEITESRDDVSGSDVNINDSSDDYYYFFNKYGSSKIGQTDSGDVDKSNNGGRDGSDSFLSGEGGSGSGSGGSGYEIRYSSLDIVDSRINHTDQTMSDHGKAEVREMITTSRMVHPF